VGGHFGPFTEVVRKIRPEVTRKMASPRQIVELLHRCLLCKGSPGQRIEAKLRITWMSPIPGKPQTEAERGIDDSISFRGQASRFTESQPLMDMNPNL
jgi:hypothetical protein